MIFVIKYKIGQKYPAEISTKEGTIYVYQISSERTAYTNGIKT